MRLCPLVLAALACRATADASEPRKIGSPVCIRELSFSLVTPHPGGYHIAWATYEGVDRNAMVGVRTDTGALTWVDTTSHGRGHLRLHAGTDGAGVLIYTGNPGRFLRYDIAAGSLVDLGVPHSPASYWMGDAAGPDGHWYVGAYPDAALVSCDVKTGEVKDHGRLPTDRREKYITATAVSDDNIVYCAVGLHHRELWSYNPATGDKRQILPESMTVDQGSPTVRTGGDGKVYGQAGAVQFSCRPDGIDITETPAATRVDADRLRASDVSVMRIGQDGKLLLTDAAGAERSVQTAYAGRAIAIYSVGCERDGKVYGGTLFPAKAFSYNLQTDALAELPDVTPKAIQIYDIAGVPQGLFFAGYMGCILDRYDPAAPLVPGENPRRIVRTIAGQERPNQWETGPDGMLYFGSTPSKGRLGGALVRVNPNDFTLTKWDSPVRDQSVMSLASLPQTGELLGCCSIAGGSSAVATEKEGSIFIWDVAGERVVWEGKPIPGAKTYHRGVRAGNGLVYLVAAKQYCAFDPARREVVATGELPLETLHFPYLSDAPVGPRGLIYGLGDDAIFAIDPADNSVSIVGRHESLRSAHGFLVTSEGALLYGSGADLWRWDLPVG